MQIKTTMRYHLTPVGTAYEKDKGKGWGRCGVKEAWLTVNGNVNWCSHREERMRFPQ